jgi:hypothetical protein
VAFYQPPSRVKPYFQRLFEATDQAFALPLALSMEAHYRERIRSGKDNCKKMAFIVQPLTKPPKAS